LIASLCSTRCRTRVKPRLPRAPLSLSSSIHSNAEPNQPRLDAANRWGFRLGSKATVSASTGKNSVTRIPSSGRELEGGDCRRLPALAHARRRDPALQAAGLSPNLAVRGIVQKRLVIAGASRGCPCGQRFPPSWRQNRSVRYANRSEVRRRTTEDCGIAEMSSARLLSLLPPSEGRFPSLSGRPEWNA
jgi:hypothetical protein